MADLRVVPRPTLSTNVARFDSLAGECLDIFRRKNADYGDSFREDGLMGILVRLKDKINRTLNILDHEDRRMVRSETLRDTLIDLSNYALMGVVVYDLDRPGLIAHTTRRLLSALGVDAGSVPIYESIQAAQRDAYISGESLGGLERYGLATELTRVKQTIMHWLAKARFDGEMAIWQEDTRKELLAISLIPLEAIIVFEGGK